jgi:uncharacterized repeat protein (TIGR03803 family)
MQNAVVILLVWVSAGLGTAQTANETVLHNFGRREGASVYTGVVRDAAGNLYGAAGTGGATYAGVLFKVDPAGNYTVIHSFTGGDGGNDPNGVILDAEGNLYGAAWGGTHNAGLIYRLDTAGHYTVLYNFKGGRQWNGINTLLRDPAGNFYGTTEFGGTGGNCAFGSGGCGVMYKVDAAGNFTVLHNFTSATGGNPTAGMVRDAAGNLYGTTEYDGAHVQGTVYKFDTSGRYIVLYSFTGKADGAAPYAGVVLDPSGNLYGTTRNGGAANDGVVYKVDTAGRFTVLYSFTDADSGNLPDAGVTLDAAGNLYGTRPYTSSASGGVVYKLDTAGNYTGLYGFTGGPDGSEPLAAVTLDAAGNIYGTTVYGGGTNGGVVYKVDTAGRESVLHSFPNGGFGSFPLAGVARDAAGNLYGTTNTGGAMDFGVAYKLDAAGGYTALHSFTIADGAGPIAGVTLDPAGNLYGTTTLGGSVAGSCTGSSYPSGCGVVYKIDPAGRETVLHSFTGGADGEIPFGGVIRDAAGNLYGTASGAGTPGHGVIFKIDAAGNYTVLYSFQGGTDGAGPEAGVIRDAAGNLYGTACCGGTANQGVVYKFDAAGNYTVLYSFTGGADGGVPMAGVVRDPAGNLYGTTTFGGTGTACGGSCGVVYKVDPAGQETVLHSFAGEADGGAPYAGVIRDAAGNLYGTASNIGTGGGGVVYKLDAAGNYTVLYGFGCGTDGCSPRSGLLLDAVGNLYGTTYEGGTRGTGVVFKILAQ